MSQTTHNARGDIALTLLRWGVLATGSMLVGVMAHLLWKAVAQ